MCARNPLCKPEVGHPAVGEFSSGLSDGLRRTARNGRATKAGAHLTRVFDLIQTVGAAAEEGQETEVAEDLELLADFVADVRVFWMKTREGIGMGIHIGKSEFHFAEGLHYLKHVQGPASPFNM